MWILFTKTLQTKYSWKIKQVPDEKLILQIHLKKTMDLLVATVPQYPHFSPFNIFDVSICVYAEGDRNMYSYICYTVIPNSPLYIMGGMGTIMHKPL